jgi:hypothetical protein
VTEKYKNKLLNEIYDKDDMLTNENNCQNQGVLHNHGGDSFFQKDKSCIGPKLLLKSILLFYKDLLEIKSYLLGGI